MNVRVCFSKFGRLRFLGHLDVMRFFQRAITRSGIPIAYSLGFHPHMILSFAQPLALSMTSDGEYFDCELSSENVDPDELRVKLQEQMCDGFEIQSVSVLPEREPNTRKQTGMSQIAGAMYLCEALPEWEEPLRKAFEMLSECKSATVEKQAKKGTRPVDVRAGIHAMGIVSDDGAVSYAFDDGIFRVPETLTDGFGRERSEHAEHRDGSVRFLFAVDAGSENNISVELIGAALRKMTESAGNGVSSEIPERCMTSHRMELYRLADEHMVSLGNV